MEGAWNYGHPRAWTVHPRGLTRRCSGRRFAAPALFPPAERATGRQEARFFSDSAGMGQGVRGEDSSVGV
jgi:hypothetical protein